MPSMRSACPRVRGRTTPSFWRSSSDSPGIDFIVDTVRKPERFIPAEARDILGLAVEIHRILGIDLELFGDFRLERGELRPNPRELARTKIRGTTEAR